MAMPKLLLTVAVLVLALGWPALSDLEVEHIASDAQVLQQPGEPVLVAAGRVGSCSAWYGTDEADLKYTGRSTAWWWWQYPPRGSRLA